MRYWWVSQNQTCRHEVGGGHLWSPKRRKGGVRNYFYETMREVSPGVSAYYTEPFHQRWILAALAGHE